MSNIDARGLLAGVRVGAFVRSDLIDPKLERSSNFRGYHSFEVAPGNLRQSKSMIETPTIPFRKNWSQNPESSGIKHSSNRIPHLVTRCITSTILHDFSGCPTGFLQVMGVAQK